jgi:hypothetical protein
LKNFLPCGRLIYKAGFPRNKIIVMKDIFADMNIPDHYIIGIIENSSTHQKILIIKDEVKGEFLTNNSINESGGDFLIMTQKQALDNEIINVSPYNNPIKLNIRQTERASLGRKSMSGKEKRRLKRKNFRDKKAN